VSIDKAHNQFSTILEDINKNLQNIVSEEDGKIQIIVRVLTEVLGWSHSEISAEIKHDNGFSDLILSSDNKQAFLIEAKRKDALSVSTQEITKLRHLKLNGPTLKDAEKGINQAASYASPQGLPFAVLTDGFVWIIFKPFVPGSNFKSHEAFVFPSLEAIRNDFAIFFELLSKDSFAKKLYAALFDKLHNSRLLLTQKLKAPVSDNAIKPVTKTPLAFDLDQIFSAFFSRLTGDADEELLIECFVETRESRIADFALEKITTNVLGNISPSNKDVDAQLSTLIKQTVEVDTGETVFIVGPTGAGKSTFLDRFFKKTLSPILSRQCVVANVNCLDSSGRSESALEWLTETLIQTLEKQVYNNGAPNWEELRALYFSEYCRRRDGVDAHLYKRSPEEFKEKFSLYLDEKVEADREGYLKRILTDIVCNRKKLPIIIVDNTDEFSEEFKKEIFQYAQSLRREANHCILLFPVTDKSAWSFSKTDLYSIYKSKSFFLPTPPPREVFRKRIDFIKEKLNKMPSDKARREYLARKGIRITFENLTQFAKVLENVFVEHEYTSKTIGEISNYNIRRTLTLAQRVITSPVYPIDDLLKAVISGSITSLSYSKFINGLLKGDFDLYKQNDNHFIFPIYQVDDQVRQSPLIYLRILSLLKTTFDSARNVDDRHVTVQSLISYFDSIGCSEIALDTALVRLLQAGLIEPFDSSLRDLSATQKFSITFSGERHLGLALHNNIFFEQMAITTAIVDHDVAEEIRNIYFSKNIFSDKMDSIRNVFLNYLLKEDSQHVQISSTGEQFLCQRDLIETLQRFGVSDKFKKTEGTPNTAAEEVIATGVVATVDWFDFEKGFGFVDIENQSNQAYLHKEVLKSIKQDRVFDGDKLLCDISKNEKGMLVTKVYDLEEENCVKEIVEAKIDRVFPERRYGFVKISDGVRSAYFHFSSFDAQTVNTFKKGKVLKVEISPDKTGEGFQVRRLVS
jgi:cold shock CspA family protein